MLCLLVALGIGVFGLVRRPQSAVLPREQHGIGASATDSRAGAASVLLGRLGPLLETGTAKQLSGLAAPGDVRARHELDTLRSNVRSLGVTHLTMRYVDEDAGRLSGAQQHAFGDHAWVGDVQLAWRLRGFDTHDSLMETRLTLRDDGSGARFVSARQGYGDATPLWMLGRVRVERSGRSLVVATTAAAARRLSSLADQAVSDVRKVLPRWRGRLVVEVPVDQTGLTRVLGSEPGAYAEIAAVTTTADGSLAPAAPVHIFVNPRVFDPLGPRGSQIVMSHEATHVATGAASSSMPTWLLEGFADYVALAHAHLPVTVTASQILALVRRKGPPDHLPGGLEFDPQNTRLGASYESAWLACRLLAQRYGERRLIEFYRSAQRSSSTTGPFRSVLHTSQPAFTRAWRNDLRRLAG